MCRCSFFFFCCVVLHCIKLLNLSILLIDICAVSSTFAITTNTAIKFPGIHTLIYTYIYIHTPTHPGVELFGCRVYISEPFCISSYMNDLKKSNQQMTALEPATYFGN